MRIEDTLSSKDLERYIHFCRNPLHSPEQIKANLEKLCSLPGIKGIGFYNDHTLMLGTQRIYINHGDRTYDIGEFIIFIIRRHFNPEWRVSFRFRNITYSPAQFNGCIHPHIVLGNFTEIGIETGKLCISQGQYPLYQRIRKAELYEAARVFLTILRTYDSDAPWHYIQNWPNTRRQLP